MTKPALEIRPLTEDEVTFTIHCEEEDVPVEGNYISSGDDDYDKKVEKEVRQELNAGNLWAWCFVRIEATWGSFKGCDTLGGCCYESEEDFKKDGGYFEDMKQRALADLNANIAATFASLRPLLIEDQPRSDEPDCQEPRGA